MRPSSAVDRSAYLRFPEHPAVGATFYDDSLPVSTTGLRRSKDEIGREGGHVVIKPSELAYDEFAPDNLYQNTKAEMHRLAEM